MVDGLQWDYSADGMFWFRLRGTPMGSHFTMYLLPNPSIAASASDFAMPSSRPGIVVVLVQRDCPLPSRRKSNAPLQARCSSSSSRFARRLPSATRARLPGVAEGCADPGN